MIKRKNNHQIQVGNIKIGGQAPIRIQSMTKTDTRDIKATLKQIKSITKAGAELVRLGIPDQEAADCFKKISNKSSLPLIADIHFDYKLAIKCIENGANKIRFNPGNIGNKENIHKLVLACKKAKIPIRIGINSGSVEKDILEKYKILTQKKLSLPPQALVESALNHIQILEKEDFYDICVSIKSVDPLTTIQANKILAKKINYPIHLGITEAGIYMPAITKSVSGLAPLLIEGIGDTIRISLTDKPEKEIEIAKEILQSLNLRRFHPEFISCPGCSRTEFDLRNIAQEIYKKTKTANKNLKIAVMGCLVNGLGEAKEADFALIGGKEFCVLYKNGEFVKKVSPKKVVEEFLDLIFKA